VTIPVPLRAAAALAALLLLTGCAQRGTAGPAPAPSATPPSVELPDDDAALVLRVEYVGGFLPLGAMLNRVPGYSLYADGQLITDGPVPAVYPGPALPNVQVRRLDEATLQELADRAVAAGIAETTDLGSPPVADAPSTRFTLTTADGTAAREVYALFEYGLEHEGPNAGLTDEQVAGRARLRELLTALSDAGHAAVERYVPVAVAAVAMPWADPEDDLVHPELPWPGPELPGEPTGGPLEAGCVVATGAQAEAVLAAGAGANAATPWVSGGTRWSVLLRPLLPDESGCADLGD
jgi:hypothetical protein